MQTAHKIAKLRIIAVSQHSACGLSYSKRGCRTKRTQACIQQQQYLISSQYGELRPTNGWDRLASVRRPSKSQRVSRLGVFASLLHRRRSTHVNQILHVWPSPGLVGLHHVHFRGLLSPRGILPGAKFTLRPSLAFSHIILLDRGGHSEIFYRDCFF